MSAKSLERDLFLGFIRIHILHHAAEEAVYGSELAEELASHGYSVSYGTLYPILHRLASDGLLEDERRTVAGKVRKYYRITDTGRLMLERARGFIRELVEEVLGEHSNIPGARSAVLGEGNCDTGGGVRKRSAP